MRGFMLKFNLVETRLSKLGLIIKSIDAVYGLKDDGSMGYSMVTLNNSISQQKRANYIIVSKRNELPPGLGPTSSIDCKISITLENSEGLIKILEHSVFDIRLRRKTDNDLVILPIDHDLAIPEFFDNLYEADLYALIDPYTLVVEFVKAPYADWHQAANQDQISPNLWITRMNGSSLINYKYWSTQIDPNTGSNYFSADQNSMYNSISDTVWSEGDLGMLGNAKVLLDTTMVNRYTTFSYTDFMKSTDLYGYNQSINGNPNPIGIEGFNLSILSSLPGGVPQLGNIASYTNPNYVLLTALNYLRNYDKTKMRQYSEISNQLYIIVREVNFTDPANKRIKFELWNHPPDAYLIKDYEPYQEVPEIGDVFYYPDYMSSLQRNDGTGVSDTNFFTLRTKVSGPSDAVFGINSINAYNVYEYVVDTDASDTDIQTNTEWSAIDIFTRKALPSHVYTYTTPLIYITKRTPHVSYFQNLYLELQSTWCARCFGSSMDHFYHHSKITNTNVLGTWLMYNYGYSYSIGTPLLIYIPEDDKYVRLIIDEWYSAGKKGFSYFGEVPDNTGSFKYRRSEPFSINPIDQQKFVADANGVSDYYNMNTNKVFAKKTTITLFEPANTIGEPMNSPNGQDVVNNDVILVADDYGLIFNYKLIEAEYLANGAQYDANSRQTYMGIQTFADLMNSDGHKEIYDNTDVLFGIEHFGPWSKDYFVPLENIFISMNNNNGGMTVIDAANVDNTSIHLTRNVNKPEFEYLFAKHGNIETFMSFKKMSTIATNMRYRPSVQENHPLNTDPTDTIVDAAYNQTTGIWEAHWKSGAKTSNNHKMLLLGLPIIGYLPAVNQYFKLRLNLLGMGIDYGSTVLGSYIKYMDGNIEWIRSGLFREDWNISIHPL